MNDEIFALETLTISDSEMAEHTDEAIMEATYQALCKHGYPATSISKITDEFSKSTSLLYYHYEDKENLLEDLLCHLLDQLEDQLVDLDQEGPYDYLMAVIDQLLPTQVDNNQFRFQRALLELRSQAPHIDAYHKQFQRLDELVLSEFTTTIETGIERGLFREIDPEQTAVFMYSTVYGALERGVSLEDASLLQQNRQTLEEYVRSNMLVEE
ncbi:TetR/AcrR family transcriptional regulator [Halorubrum sp. AJ67]|uniref:TetR/AcrR family transcriptional regulator n=1 Tax=Halorubrum sp. AJ67 TaxID=1173487 RepID=UPI0003DC05C0|nr:TetR/AcrR family transcriptional regulator [Halorubrum sp. AJ67]CDK40333.1 transcriptional regulator [Halorubrum sp. AJ67]